MFGAFVRAIGKALRAIRKVLTDQKGEMENDRDEVYRWHRYKTNLCPGICAPREGSYTATITAIGEVKLSHGPETLPPGHPGCDCAMLNTRTGQFRWTPEMRGQGIPNL